METMKKKHGNNETMKNEWKKITKQNEWKKITKQKFRVSWLTIILVAIVCIPTTLSIPNYVVPLQSIYGNGSCTTCHVNPGGGGRNYYGISFENQPNHVKDPVTALQNIGAPPRKTISLGPNLTSLPIYEGQIEWAGHTWDVRSGSGEPGPNDWSDSSNNVWVDTKNRLHLKITNTDGNWYNAGISTSDNVGYGTYTFKMVTDPTMYPRNVVAGMFYWLWSGKKDELDIEFSQWDSQHNPNTQYTVWTNDWVSNTVSPMYETIGTNTTHKMVWSQNSIYFEGPAGNWKYPGSYRPNPGGTYAINLWVYDRDRDGYKAPADGKEQELILESFTYVAG